MPRSGTITVLLADDQTIIREALSLLLSGMTDIAVVGEAGTRHDVVEAAERLAPAVVVMDLGMPIRDGLAATRGLVALDRSPRVLLMTVRATPEHVSAVLEAGAAGFVREDATGAELVAAIRAVAAGDPYVGHHGATPDTCAARFTHLSGRERQVMQLVAAGYTGPETGRTLGIAAKSVETYKRRIERKLGLAHRPDYVRFAVEAGLLRRDAPLLR
jgi:DNA-binding NarL/FixJ family response regulator